MHRPRPYPDSPWSTTPSPTPTTSSEVGLQEERWFDAWPLLLLLAAIAPGAWLLLSLLGSELKATSK